MFVATILILPLILVISISVSIILLPLVAQLIYIQKLFKTSFVVRFSFGVFGLGLIGSGPSYLCLNLLRGDLGHQGPFKIRITASKTSKRPTSSICEMVLLKPNVST